MLIFCATSKSLNLISNVNVHFQIPRVGKIDREDACLHVSLTWIWILVPLQSSEQYLSPMIPEYESQKGPEHHWVNRCPAKKHVISFYSVTYFIFIVCIWHIIIVLSPWLLLFLRDEIWGNKVILCQAPFWKINLLKMSRQLQDKLEQFKFFHIGIGFFYF